MTDHDPILDRQRLQEAEEAQVRAQIDSMLKTACEAPVREMTVMQHLTTAIMSAMVQHPTGGGLVFKSTASMDGAAAAAARLARSVLIECMKSPTPVEPTDGTN